MSKTDDTIVTVGAPFPKIAAVQALEGFQVLVKWKTGKQVVVDLAPMILTYKAYAPLRDNRTLFESVHTLNASVIAWGDDDAIDMHVSQIEKLAGEVMEAADFKAFMQDLGLTRDGAAAQLGISRRMVGYYAEGREIPRTVALACAYLVDQKKQKSLLRVANPSIAKVGAPVYYTVKHHSLHPAMIEMGNIEDIKAVLFSDAVLNVEQTGSPSSRPVSSTSRPTKRAPGKSRIARP
jgi:DNA-binding transcriptional regulator YiaG